MKIVGGPHDGRIVAVPPEKNDYLVCELADSCINILCSERERLPPLEFKYTRYTIRRLRVLSRDATKFDYLEFLAPQDWSDMDALIHQFAK